MSSSFLHRVLWLLLLATGAGLSGCRSEPGYMRLGRGSYWPELPDPNEYPDRSWLPADAAVAVSIAGIRPETWRQEILLMDFIVESNDPEVLVRIAEKLEVAATGGGLPEAELRTDGHPVQIVGWRQAMYDRQPYPYHLSVYSEKARQTLRPTAGALHRESITFTFETTAWELLQRAERVDARIRREHLEREGFEWQDVHLNSEWTPITVAPIPVPMHEP